MPPRPRDGFAAPAPRTAPDTSRPRIRGSTRDGLRWLFETAQTRCRLLGYPRPAGAVETVPLPIRPQRICLSAAPPHGARRLGSASPGGAFRKPSKSFATARSSGSDLRVPSDVPGAAASLGAFSSAAALGSAPREELGRAGGARPHVAGRPRPPALGSRVNAPVGPRETESLANLRQSQPANVKTIFHALPSDRMGQGKRPPDLNRVPDGGAAAGGEIDDYVTVGQGNDVAFDYARFSREAFRRGQRKRRRNQCGAQPIRRCDPKP